MLIRDADGVVAHAGLCLRQVSLHGVTVAAGALGAVFTRKDVRGRGLGAAVVGATLERARTARAALALVSGDGPLYRRLGFTPAPAATAWAHPLPPAAQSTEDAAAAATAALGEAVDLRLAVEADIPLLARIHDAEPVRFCATPPTGARCCARRWSLRGRAKSGSSPPPRSRRIPGSRPADSAAARTSAGDRDALLAVVPRVTDEVVVPA